MFYKHISDLQFIHEVQMGYTIAVLLSPLNKLDFLNFRLGILPLHILSKQIQSAFKWCWKAGCYDCIVYELWRKQNLYHTTAAVVSQDGRLKIFVSIACSYFIFVKCFVMLECIYWIVCEDTIHDISAFTANFCITN